MTSVLTPLDVTTSAGEETAIPSRDLRGGGRRVLVVAWAFPPAAPIGTFRTLRFTRQLIAEGWTATVLSAAPGTYLPSTPVDQALLRRVPTQVTVVHAPVLRGVGTPRNGGRATPGTRPAPSGDTTLPQVRARFRVLRKLRAFVGELKATPDREVGWVVPAVLKGLLTLRRQPAAALYSSAPPWSGHLVALALARATGLPWIADFRDPWARQPWREARSRSVRNILAVLERWVVKRAEAVLFATRTNRDEYAGFYGPAIAAKFHVIPNGCEPEEFAGIRGEPPTDRFVMVHAGSLYGARTPVPLFRAIASAIRSGAIDPRRFRLRLIGVASDGHNPLRGAAVALGLEDVVEFVPRLNREETLREMAEASCLLVLQPGTTMSIPGKLYEYLAVGRPILALTEEGETADLVRASGMGVSVLPEDEPGIEAALDRLVAGRSGRPVARVPVHLYDGNIAARQAIAVMADVIAART
jgi:glycosyltransferase involved in cell wall biosynthesis